MEQVSAKSRIPIYNRIMKLINIVFISVYFVLGAWFLTEEATLFEVPIIQQRILGGVFMLYSIYRSYRFCRDRERNHQFTNSYEDDIP